MESPTQFLLRSLDCERQYTFNNIVDPKQRVMGMLLDGSTEEEASKFLLVTKAKREFFRKYIFQESLALCFPIVQMRREVFDGVLQVARMSSEAKDQIEGEVCPPFPNRADSQCT